MTDRCANLHLIPNSTPSRTPMNDDLKARLGGVFLILCGGGLAWFTIWRPYQQALAGEPSISYSTKGIALGVLFPLAGLLLAVFGARLNDRVKQLNATRKGSVQYWLYIAIIAAIAIGSFLYIKSRFTALGYA
jgi:uncharacterized membrane protein YidH (DUF202 family)